MDDPLRAEENGRSVEAIGRNIMQGASTEVDGMHNSSKWVDEMEKKLKDANPTTEMMQWKKTSIYQVPEWIKDMTDKDDYRPWLVSLGPFHHGKPELLPMEEHKRRAMLHLVKRSKKKLEEFVASIEEIADKLREAYQNLDKKWHRENNCFVEMIIMDGCFLLEVMTGMAGETIEDYARNDPVFSTHGLQNLYRVIRSDITLMENQLPLLALERLVTVQDGKTTTPLEIKNKILKFLGVEELEGIEYHCLHPLDILHSNICGGCPQHEETDQEDMVIPTAMELKEAGILFKKSRTPRVHDMHFKNGVLSIPEWVVDDYTEKELLNLRVFEQLHSSAGSHMTNYLIIMDHMIGLERDAQLLKTNGILTNYLSSDKALTDLFNKVANGATTNQSKQLNTMVREVNAHCRKRCNRWRAFFVRNYMSNPWVFISLVAATILLVATLAQTIYTVVPFYTES